MTHPIEAAVSPLKDEAIERATKAFDAHVERVLETLAAANWDLTVAFPRPGSNVSRADYKTQMGRHGFAASLTRATWTTRSMAQPDTRQRDEGKIEAVRSRVAAETAAAYDLFVAKLVGKVGEVETAELEGNHVWGRSTLTVSKATGAVERWMTQQIVNVSCLGKVFNQWPTRLAR